MTDTYTPETTVEGDKPMTQHDYDKWVAWASLSGNPHVAMKAAEDNANPTLVHCMGNIQWGMVTAEELPDPPPPDPPPEGTVEQQPVYQQQPVAE